MEFLILGPLDIVAGGQRLTLGRTRERTILAALLLEANRLVTLDRLVDAVWDDDPPQLARKQVRNCVSVLRAQLAAAGAAAGMISTEPAGYVLRVPPGQLDAQVFADRAERGRQLAMAGAHADAVAALRAALAAWRGPALAGMASRYLQAAAAHLDEQRLVALEQLYTHELALGRDAELLPELTGLVGEQPFRERLRGQLMLALYRCGRRADALDAYQQGRRVLITELGLEPGTELQELQRAILAGAPGLSAPVPAPALPVPAQLPAEAGAFTGRVEHLRWLDAVTAAQPGKPVQVSISAVAGTAGVGKTALAVHWANQVRDRFPGGQLYVNLRGYALSPPMRPIEAVALFLRALGMPPDRVPVDLDEAAAAYRTLISGRQVLLILDNAASAEQVRPLLPGSPGCVAVVTSRSRLEGLAAHDGANLLTLDVLAPEEAYDLLVHTIGPRAGAEPQAARELARLCGCLPLALRIAAAQLAARPHRRLASHVAELAAGNRLGVLALEGDERTAVSAAFDLSYSALSAEDRLAFRRLSLSPGTDVTAGTLAALTGAAVAESGRALRRLAAAHLVQEYAEDRFTVHDLLREYAAGRCRADDSDAERRAATGRLIGWYVTTADAAARLLHPEILRLPESAAPAAAAFGDHAEALSWIDAERANLVAIIIHSADQDFGSAAWLLADALRGYFHLRMHTVDWLAVARAGLMAAELGGSLAGQAAAQLSLGDLHWRLSSYPQAIERYAAAVTLAGAAGWREGQAAVHGNLGNVYQQAGQLAQAADEYRKALAMAVDTGWATAEAANLDNLAAVYWELGRLADAAEHSLRALVIMRRTGSRFAEGVDLTNLGEVRHAQGRLADALAHLERALALHHEVGNRGGEAETLRMLATVHRDRGHLTDAVGLAGAALELARDAGDRRYEADALNTLASLDLAAGRHQAAAQRHADALQLAREIGNRYPETEALIGLAHAARQLGRATAARHHAADGLMIARQVGYRLLEGEALAAMAVIEHDSGHQLAAARCAEQARAIRDETGHRPADPAPRPAVTIRPAWASSVRPGRTGRGSSP